MAVDGPGAAEPAALADRIAERLPGHGRPAVVIRAESFWRDAALRFEYGRQDVESYYTNWLDAAALRREALGDGPVLPSLRDPTTNRATREPVVPLAADGVVIVAGELLLGRGLPFDLTIHLAVSPAALRRRTPAQLHWTLAALERYDAEVGPSGIADITARYDDPRRPALRVG